MEWEWRSHQTMIPTLLKTIYLNYSIINKIIINWMACRTMPNVITIKFECDRSSVSCCQCSMSAYCPSVLKIFFSLLLVHLNFKAILYRILCNQKRMQSTVEYDQTLNVFRIFIGVQVSLHVRAHNNSLVRMCWLLWNCVFFCLFDRLRHHLRFCCCCCFFSFFLPQSQTILNGCVSTGNGVGESCTSWYGDTSRC